MRSICIHFQQRFQIDAFSVNTLSVFKRISVDGRPKRINSGADLGYVQSVARLTYFLQRNINLLFQNLNNLFPLRL